MDMDKINMQLHPENGIPTYRVIGHWSEYKHMPPLYSKGTYWKRSDGLRAGMEVEGRCFYVAKDDKVIHMFSSFSGKSCYELSPEFLLNETDKKYPFLFE